MTSLAMLGSMIMAMGATVISRIVTTLSKQLQRHRRIGVRPKTTTSKVHRHPLGRQLSCLHRLSDDGSDVFVMSPEQPRMDGLLSTNKDTTRLVASSGTALQNTATGNNTSMNQTATRLRSLGSRHVLVKDTAFQT